MPAAAPDDDVQAAASPRKFAVFGNPIKHSKSPLIHAAFAKQFGHLIEYRAVRVDPGDFPRAARAFFAGGGSGLNVTLPFKTDALAFADRQTGRAQHAGAANTLFLDEQNAVVADNTDGLGLVRDMVLNLGWSLQGKRILVLGAGGAVRGVLEPLLQENPHSVFIANRTAQRAHALQQHFANLGALAAGGFDSLEGREFDLIINGTSAGLSGEMPPLQPAILTERSCCYDMVYGAQPTAFMRWAAQHAAWSVADGLGMLVEQAAESYYRWQRVRPQTTEVLRAVRSALLAAG